MKWIQTPNPQSRNLPRRQGGSDALFCLSRPQGGLRQEAVIVMSKTN